MTRGWWNSRQVWVSRMKGIYVTPQAAHLRMVKMGCGSVARQYSHSPNMCKTLTQSQVEGERTVNLMYVCKATDRLVMRRNLGYKVSSRLAWVTQQGFVIKKKKRPDRGGAHL